MFKFKIKWDQDPIKKFGELKKSVEKRILLNAVRKASADVRRALKAGAPKLSGALRVSLGLKAMKSKRGIRAVGIIGPKFQYTRDFNGKTVRPGRYNSPLVSGHKKPGGGRVDGIDYITDVWKSHETNVMGRVMSEIADGIVTELAKKGRK